MELELKSQKNRISIGDMAKAKLIFELTDYLKFPYHKIDIELDEEGRYYNDEAAIILKDYASIEYVIEVSARVVTDRGDYLTPDYTYTEDKKVQITEVAIIMEDIEEELIFEEDFIKTIILILKKNIRI